MIFISYDKAGFSKKKRSSRGFSSALTEVIASKIISSVMAFPNDIWGEITTQLFIGISNKPLYPYTVNQMGRGYTTQLYIQKFVDIRIANKPIHNNPYTVNQPWNTVRMLQVSMPPIDPIKRSISVSCQRPKGL